MTAIVTTGDNTVLALGKIKGGKRCHNRFGGEKAWRQHRGDEKEAKRDSANARRRAEQACLAAAIADVDFKTVQCSGDLNGYNTGRSDSDRETCPCTGVTPVFNGIVREGNIVLLYSDGKLLSAHCG